MDLSNREAFGLLLLPRMETYMYWLEISVGILAPLVLLSIPKVRQNKNGLFIGAVLIISGFVVNRLNISITAMEAWSKVSYFPSWMELAITAMIVTTGFIVFSLAARYLPVFKHAPAAPASHKHPFEEELLLISQSRHVEVL
jgi:Ni/Fe-hydrogenase subunit HybB-like protein